jgi:hypothetical protein
MKIEVKGKKSLGNGMFELIVKITTKDANHIKAIQNYAKSEASDAEYELVNDQLLLGINGYSGLESEWISDTTFKVLATTE